MAPHFTAKSLSLVRALKRNHRREWFAARKDDYDRHVGQPMVEVIEQYQKDDPEAEYLRYRSFLAGCEFPAEFATDARFYPTLVKTFKAVTPLVRFLNEPLGDRPRATNV